MNYITYSVIAAVCFAISQVLSKVLSKHSIENRDSLMAYFLLSTASFALFLLPFVPLELPSFELMKTLLPGVGLFLLGYYFFYTGIFQTDASSFAPLFQLQAGFVALFAYLVGIEQFSLGSYVWIALMAIGAMIVSYHEKMTLGSFFNRGIFFILLMQVCHAASNIFVSWSLDITTPLQFLFWEYVVIAGVFAAFFLIKRPKMSYSLPQIAPMFLSSYIVALGVIALFQAFTENLTISSVIGLLSSPIVFLISVLASKLNPAFLEHHSGKVYTIRAVGLIVILVAAVQLTLH